MNLILRIVAISVVVVIAQLYLPWFVIIIVPFMVELILGKQDATKFFSGFYGVAIPWLAVSGYIYFQSESILSIRILEMFKLPQYGFVLVIITGLLGGLIGGLSSLIGGWTKEAFSNG